MTDILFILKKNECYNFVSYTRRSSGLWNSTRFIVESLVKKNIKANIVEVIDNNCIDKWVTKYKPRIVIIEALWVVPEKFDVLKKLHPKVKWFVHLHSHMPFLALEGIAMEWIRKCADKGIGMIANSVESYDALRAILNCKELIYLPNVYVTHLQWPLIKNKKHVVDIGCFGALRPLKNQLLQALAAIQYAKEERKHLRFHINGSRVETGAAPVLKNLKQLFLDAPNAELVEHKWMEPEEFLHVLRHQIDIGMQVSLTETFNVVCADYVTAGIPVVASKEVKWLSRFVKAVDDSPKDIVKKLRRVKNNWLLILWNQLLLKCHSIKAQIMWYLFVRRNIKC